ncbi:MAG: cyclic nucleotide-binding domain-containing protein [Syntrophobacteria bacterium]
MELSRTVEYEDGEFIILEGGQSDGDVLVILEGQAIVTKETDKGQVILAMLEEGDVFGEVSFLAQKLGRHSASVVTKGYVKIGIMNREKLTAEHKKLSPTFQRMLQDLSERFSKTTVLASRLAARRMPKPTLEQRQASRSSQLQNLRIPVTYQPESRHARETYQAILLNLASTGMGLELYTTSFAKATHPLGAKFVFEFQLLDKPAIRMPGYIVWLQEMGMGKARMGVQFAETNPYIQKTVKEFLRSLSA